MCSRCNHDPAGPRQFCELVSPRTALLAGGCGDAEKRKPLPRSSRNPLLREKDFDFTPFERSKKNMVSVLSGFLSKGESVFCDAVDILDEVIENNAQVSPFVSFQLSEVLSASHAFDKGDTKEIGWIDAQRKDVRFMIDRHGMFPGQPQPLPELDSRESFYIQAADFAAGIALEILHRKDLVHLVAAFDYVTYNGKRLSESKAIALTADLAKRKANLPGYVQ